MDSILKILKSSIMSKIIMAVTGGILVMFVIGHMVGNLQIFLGAEPLNVYARFLQSVGEPLWVVRTVMFLTISLHIFTGVRLKLANRAARPIGYCKESTVQATLASRTMVWTGILAGIYVVYHLMHFTVHALSNAGVVRAWAEDAHGHTDVFHMIVTGFQIPYISAIYIAAMVLLGFHLYHGISSLFQTLGLNHPRYTPIMRCGGAALAILVAAGYIVIPVAIMLGLITSH
jgi:succinate dehydrogenase cytochrome b subunit